ncbi:preprotein translocase subunit YajC [Ichthyobacterium seriolicida]|uniref:Sec translocon accessory complex subunit YajC n=2 Tax=Ichthyobacterium seriolicida TaxID=242600 RepID=A0A1J1DX07_9FLAO|nr:preprotein translocase subunit YajC [Ichthyobacterium seriolicida]
MIRPQAKKQKKEKKFQNELNKGTKVVTHSGMHGKISEVNDTTCVIDTGSGKVVFEKNAISAELSLARTPVVDKKQ